MIMYQMYLVMAFIANIAMSNALDSDPLFAEPIANLD